MTFLTPHPVSPRLHRLAKPVLLLLGATVLLLLSGQARSADSTDGAPGAAMVSSTEAVGPTPAPAPTPSVTAAAPRYSASNLAMAFNYMDANHDGKVSREEAAGFRGVAKHFDRADTNHDNILSREEFDRAMNYVKPQ